MIYFAGNSISYIVLTLILSVVTPNLSLNAYVRASIVRFGEPVMMACRPVGAAVAFTELDFRLHWYLSRSFSLEAWVTLIFFSIRQLGHEPELDVPEE